MIFRFIVAREITESLTVEVEADNIEQAHEKGLLLAGECEGWHHDDSYNGEPYIPDEDDYEVFEEEGFVIRGTLKPASGGSLALYFGGSEGWRSTPNLKDARRFKSREEAQKKLENLKGWISMKPEIIPLHAEDAKA